MIQYFWLTPLTYTCLYMIGPCLHNCDVNKKDAVLMFVSKEGIMWNVIR